MDIEKAQFTAGPEKHSIVQWIVRPGKLSYILRFQPKDEAHRRENWEGERKVFEKLTTSPSRNALITYPLVYSLNARETNGVEGEREMKIHNTGNRR